MTLNTPLYKVLPAALILALVCQAAPANSLRQSQEDFRKIYKQLVEINTTLSEGSCTEAADAMAVHLRAAGLPDTNIQLIVPPDHPRQGNLVAKLPGHAEDAGALLLLAHIDVVEANPADWERDPFTLIEEDGYFFGRGTMDDKQMAAIFVDIMMRMVQSGYQPEKTIKLALTCGEETPFNFNGVSYLLKHHRDLIDADFALNEGAWGILDSNQTPVFYGIQAGEKTYQDYQLEVTNPGGHSSQPRKDNAIYELASALLRIAEYEFPVEFNATTRTYFERLATLKTGQEAQDLKAIAQIPPDPNALARIKENPLYNSVLHTTCVTTKLDAGHAPNALPQRALANVNCRIFPGHTQEKIRQNLEQVIDNPQIAVSFVDPPESTSTPPLLTDAVIRPIETLSEEMWPGTPVIPILQAGGTDGRFLTPAGIPTYGVNGLMIEPDKMFAHGLNERVLVKSVYESREFLDRLVRLYVGGE